MNKLIKQVSKICDFSPVFSKYIVGIVLDEAMDEIDTISPVELSSNESTSMQEACLAKLRGLKR